MNVRNCGLSIDYLNECFEYDAKTGLLTWKIRPQNHFRTSRGWKIFNRLYAGNKAGTEFPDGRTSYCMIGINGKRYSAHQIAYAMFYGEWAGRDIDHINGNGIDNRIENMRPVEHTYNLRNQRMYNNNTSGMNGVCLHKPTGKYAASIQILNKRIHLGLFSSKEDALAARLTAEQGHGFTKRHGRLSESQ